MLSDVPACANSTQGTTEAVESVGLQAAELGEDEVRL